MVAKLRSITRQIHWSLLIRSVAFAVGWFYLPFWLFFLVALYCYFVPFSEAGKLAVPFFALLVVCLLSGPGVFMAVILGALFYYLLLIKDLLVIDRKSAQALLTMALSFLLFREFYISFTKGPQGAALFAAFFISVVFALLLDSLVQAHADPLPDRNLRRAAGLAAFLVIAQCLIAGLFLPLDFIYQSIVVFLLGAILIDLVPEYFFGNLSLSKVRATAVVTFSLFVIVLASARWRL